MPLHFAHPAALFVLLLVPLLYGVHGYGDRRRRIALALWSPSAPPTRAAVKLTLQSAAIAVIAVALAGPTWRPPQPPTAARGSSDIVFLLDVSRSMLAADVQPDRLARAKSVVRQIAAQDLGNRVALVAFAGSQGIDCPLTVDRAFFAEALDGAGPDSVTRGGTRIGDAIRFALDRVFDKAQRERRTIVLLSDGEDHESGPEAAAEGARRARVHLVSIGFGQDSGAIVPVSATDRTPLLCRGLPVVSRLDPGTLRAIAVEGAYLHAEDPSFNAAEIYRRWIAPAGRGTAATEPAEPAWAPLVAIAILLLVVDLRIPPRRAAAAVLIATLVINPFAASAQTVQEWFSRGLAALEKHDYPEALRYFSDAAGWAPETAEIRFNLAKTLYELHSYGEAASSFERAAQMTKDAHLKAQARLGQGNSLYREASARGAARGAIAAYREALRIEPGLFAADVNLRVAERRQRQRQNLPDETATASQSSPAAPSAEQILSQVRPTVVTRAMPSATAVEKDW